MRYRHSTIRFHVVAFKKIDNFALFTLFQEKIITYNSV
jgi:hypothetical protein